MTYGRRIKQLRQVIVLSTGDHRISCRNIDNADCSGRKLLLQPVTESAMNVYHGGTGRFRTYWSVRQ